MRRHRETQHTDVRVAGTNNHPVSNGQGHGVSQPQQVPNNNTPPSPQPHGPLVQPPPLGTGIPTSSADIARTFRGLSATQAAPPPPPLMPAPSAFATLHPTANPAAVMAAAAAAAVRGPPPPPPPMHFSAAAMAAAAHAVSQAAIINRHQESAIV